MRIDGVIWLRHIVDKLASKHRVRPEEVEEALANKPKLRFIEKGERKGEDVYLALEKAKRDASVLTLKFADKIGRHSRGSHQRIWSR